MDEYQIFEFLEADYNEEQANKKKRRRLLRQDYYPFELDDEEFIKRYRLTKDLVRILCEDLRPLMRKPVKRTDLSVETKVLTALSFFGSDSYQRPNGNLEGHCIAQQTVSHVLKEFTTCLNTPLIRDKYIHFPANDEERSKVKSEFYNKFNIPGVLGCIGCMYVPIVRPSHDAHKYERHKHHYLKVQVVCDANMEITSVDASHGGAIHESSIWSNHPLNKDLAELSNFEDIWFLGNSEHPLTKTMMTPIKHPKPDSPEAYYNNLHAYTQNTVKHTIRLLKARFRCLLGVLFYTPEMAGSIVNACVILHNICNRFNIPAPQINDVTMDELKLDEKPNNKCENRRNNDEFQQGLATRSALIRQLWDKRFV